MLFKIMMFLYLPCLSGLASTIDYCKLCVNGTHTMCRYTEGPAKTCYEYKKIELTDQLKQYIVNIHNDIRNHVASGRETKGGLGSQPSAADMSLLQWDNELAVIAQRWADQCIIIGEPLQHDICKKSERFEVGQNIITAITTETEVPELAILILNWYKQVTNVISSDIDNFSGIKRGQFLIGQYTQLVWAKTKYVGCGLSVFKEPNSSNKKYYHHRLVCNYGPAGNIIGQPVYQRGTPCSQCIFKKCDILRNYLCQGLSNDKLNATKNLRLNFPNYEIIVSEIVKNTFNNSFCLIPGEHLSKNKCIHGINSQSKNIRAKIKHYTTTAVPHILKDIIQYDFKEETSILSIIDLVQSTKSLKNEPEVTERKKTNLTYFVHGLEEEVIIIANHKNDLDEYKFNISRQGKLTKKIWPIYISENKLIFSDNIHFGKSKGKWYYGHCRCDRTYRSSSNNLEKITVKLILAIACGSNFIIRKNVC